MQKETFFIVILHLLLQHMGSTVTHPRMRHGHTYGYSRPLFSNPRHVGVDAGDDMGMLEAFSPVVGNNVGEDVDGGRSITVSVPCCKVMFT
jgi:hypothetical protein